MKKIIFFIMAASLFGCNKEPKLHNILISENRDLASVLKLENDKNRVYMTDFFPTLEGIDSVTSRTLDVIADTSTWERFTVTLNRKSGWINEIRAYKNGAYVSILAKNMTRNMHIDEIPVIITSGYKNNEVMIWDEEDAEKIYALWQNILLPKEFIVKTENGFNIKIPIDADSMKRSYIRVFATNEDGISNDILIPLQGRVPINNISQLTRTDQHSMILYSLMIDRFNNGNTENDNKLNIPEVLDKVDYQGGDIAGITQKIKDGFFNNLGVNTLWLSPITQNPYDAWGQYKDPKTKFSGYHGYWPIYATVVDKRFGTEMELRELLDEAHKKNLNVILDYVANHMHINSPTLKAHPEWTTELYLPDGRENLELWDEYRLTTWFDKHIPTLDLERAEVANPMTDSALFWIENFDFDGFRHDATKHIPQSFWRMLTKKMRTKYPDKKLYQIGETYGSPELIDSYVKSGMLDGQFDFNVYDEATWAIGTHDGNFKNLAATLQKSLNTYGYHNQMGYITGNHDRPRFISLAGEALRFDEDSKDAGWKREITVGDTTAYDKLALLEAFIFTIPGIPCVYQGDEYGVPGANDPDNRRMMQFDNYKKAEQELLDKVKKLIEIRKNSLPMIYGEIIPLYTDADIMVYMRVYLGSINVIALNKSTIEKNITVEIPFDELYIANLKSNFANAYKIKKDKVSFSLKPLSFEVLTPKKSN